MPNDKPANEEVVFRCACCGGVFNVDRLNGDGPFDFEQTTRRFGGKTGLSDYEREWRTYETLGRGSGHGKIDYEPWEKPDPEVREAFLNRIKEVENELAG